MGMLLLMLFESLLLFPFELPSAPFVGEEEVFSGVAALMICEPLAVRTAQPTPPERLLVVMVCVLFDHVF